MTLINSAPVTSTDIILSHLDDMSYNFRLTGSRRFGNVTPTSDWDLFTEYSLETINALQALGFINRGKDNPYEDMDCRMVLRHQSANIDIQLRTDVDTYEQVCQFIAHRTQVRSFLNNLDKPERHTMWDILLQLKKF